MEFSTPVIACLVATLALLAAAVGRVRARVLPRREEHVSGAPVVSHYALEAKIGEGGMGIVFRARHRTLRRTVAIKLLPAARAGALAIARFERDVGLASALTHPSTITVYDHGRTDEGTFYYAMELLDGATLEHIVAASGPFSPARVAHVLRQVAGSLGEAHAAGLLHRDVKPANIMLCTRGGEHDVVKVLDFGIVRHRDEGSSIALGDPAGLLGTPHCLSPEAISTPLAAGPASDLYGLGAVAYFLLTGGPVFAEATTVVEICSAHVTRRPARPSERTLGAIPRALEDLVLACLAKEPENRPASAAALQEALARAGVPTWTEADAHAWWRAHGIEVGRHVVRPGGR